MRSIIHTSLRWAIYRCGGARDISNIYYGPTRVTGAITLKLAKLVLTEVATKTDDGVLLRMPEAEEICTPVATRP